MGTATGQAFDMDFFNREGFVYDTEPACRAVVTARRLMPRMALPFMARIQQAFYAENRDMTAPEVIAEVAEEAGFDRAAFAAAFASPETRNETFRDFLTAQSLGIHGFPTLIAGSEAQRLCPPHQRLPAAGGSGRAAGALARRRRAGDEGRVRDVI